ncbi:MAG: hypothetical protein WBB67_14555 [bacterium]
MLKKGKTLGLCSTCKKAEFCTYTIDPERPVSQCNDYAGYEYPGVRTANPVVSQNADWLIKSNFEHNQGSDEYRGLCKNCKHRETCNFIKPEAGVWCCEEYSGY